MNDDKVKKEIHSTAINMICWIPNLIFNVVWYMALELEVMHRGTRLHVWSSGQKAARLEGKKKWTLKDEFWKMN